MNMSTEHDMAPVKPTGKVYNSVGDMMRGEGVSDEVKSKVAELEDETRIVLQLAKLRQKSGLKQEDIAKRLNVQQSAISKLESGKDEDLTVKEIGEYSKATGQRIAVYFGKPLTHVEAVKMNALAIKKHLEALAKIANQDEELESEIKGFFGEAFFNILTILGTCNGQLRNSGEEFTVTMEVKTDPHSKKDVEARSTLAEV